METKDFEREDIGIKDDCMDETAFSKSLREKGMTLISSIDGRLIPVPVNEMDPSYINALRAVIKANTASLLIVQKNSGGAFHKAGMIMEWMEQNAYITKLNDQKQREVLITLDEFETVFKLKPPTPEFVKGLKLVIKKRCASISLLQKHLGVEYEVAGNMIEWMAANSYISPFDGVRSRKVLLTMDEFKEQFGEDI